jgi:dGTPase
LVTWKQLQTVPLLDRLIAELSSDVPLKMRRQAMVRRLLDLQVMSVLNHSGSFLSQCSWSSFKDAAISDFAADMDPDLLAARGQLAAFLHQTLYRHDRLLAVRDRAQREICWLFDFYQAHPDHLPAMYQSRAERVGIRRSIGDYLAGMTDRFCHDQFQRFQTTSPSL